MIKENFVRFISALLVKLAAYSVISALYVFLLLWSGAIQNYSLRYVALGTITLLFLRIFITETFIRSEMKEEKKRR